MSWPAANVSLANVGAASNRISNARADIYDAFTKLNEIITEGPAIEAVAVAGQSTITTSGGNGTLTLVAGGNVTITTNATASSVTINSTGGGGGLTDIVDDTTPQLGGDLDVNDFSIYNSNVDGGSRRNIVLGDTTYGSELTEVTIQNGYLNIDKSGTANQLTITNDKLEYVTSSGTQNVRVENGITIADGSGNAGSITQGTSGSDIIIDGASTNQVDIYRLALGSQATGTPANTATPTGYINVKINGTTRYIPYYT